jgi:outer membrane immunogenic protein
MTKGLIGRPWVAALLFAGTAPAFAADLPAKAPTYKAPIAVPAYDWTGVYVGVNLGYSVGRDPANLTEGIFAASEAVGIQPAGVVGGVQAGYNWQFAPHWMTGIEADFQGTDQRSNDCLLRCLPGPGGVSETFEQRLPWFGTLRGRLGWVSGPLLVYGTGGLAYGREETKATVIDGAVGVINTVAQTRIGWAAGFGVEAALGAALGGNWTAKAEYLHTDLGSRTDNFNLTPFIGFANTQYFRDDVFRLGVNYRPGAPQPVAFGGAYAAVGMPNRNPLYSWSGVHGGINVGYGIARNPTSFVATGFQPQSESFNLDPAGVLGGGQLGVNWQSGYWVLGLETDIQGESSSVAPSLNCITTCSPGIGVQVDQHLHWFGTTRARVGWANGPLLYYATGGVAYGEVETIVNNANTTFLGGTVANGVTVRSTRIGWTGGGGIEGQLFGNWTAKGEYLFVDLGSQSGSYSTNFGLGNIQNATISTSVREHIFRLGLNYRFF